MKKLSFSIFVVQLLLIHLRPAAAQQAELVVPIGHTAGEVSTTISPDGKLILTYSTDDPMAKLWDLQGHELQSFQPEQVENVLSATFFPNGEAVLMHIYYETEDYEPVYTVRAWKLNGEPFAAFNEKLEKVTQAIFSLDRQSLITGSMDGIIKIWDLNGQQQHIFQAHHNPISSITISPDEQFMVTASLNGNTGEFEQKLWKIGQQEMVSDLSHFSSVIFAPNSRYLLEKGFSWQEDKLTLMGLDGASLQIFNGPNQARFSPDGRFVILEYRSGPIKTWEIASGQFQEFEPGTLIVFSPDDQYRLQENEQQETVELLNLQNRESRIYRGFSNGIKGMTFSPDGTIFLTNEQDGEKTTLKLFTIETGIQQAAISFDGTASILGFSPDRQFLLIRNNQKEIIVLNRELRRIGVLRGYTNGLSDVFFSEDNTSIIINDYPVNKSWNLASNSIQPSEETKPFYAGYTGDVLWSPDRQYIFGASADDPTPSLYPQSEEAKEAMKARTGQSESQDFAGHTSTISSVAFSADGQLLLSGSWDKTARLWNLSGQNLQIFKNHADRVQSVAFRPDQQLILTGTNKLIKLWRPDSPEELITLIPVDATDWIVTTPSGLFDASPRALNLMHFSLFYPAEQTYIVIDVEQLKARYYEPGLLQKVLGYSDERLRPVEAFDAIKLYPKVEVKIARDSLHIDLHARNGGIGKVSIFINGKEIVEEVNPLPRRENANRDSIIRYDLKQHQNFLLRHPDSTNTISIRAYNEEGWLKSPAVELEYKSSTFRSRGSSRSEGGSAWISQSDPKLYVVSVGTSNYTGTQLDLQYADQDASMMAKAMQAVGTALFTNGDSLEVHCLSTIAQTDTTFTGTPIQWQFADKENIQSVFKAVRQRAKAEDVVVVYLSGHGVTYGSADRAQFHYLTQGIASEDLSDAAIRQAYTISSEELTEWLKAIPALKQVLIIDACNSGQIVENLTGGTKALNSSQIRALDRMKDRTGMFVLSGSASDKVSYEAGEYGQGLLTYALLQGMMVASQKTADGQYIDVMKLFQYARDEVPRLAASINGIQTPMLGFPNKGASFDIGILNDDTEIPIGSKKPVVIRSVFLNAVSLIDDLKMVERLEVAFQEEMEKGKDADFIYVDVNDYPIGYSLSGIYEQKEGQIFIKINLVQNGKPIASLAVEEDSDPDRLSKRILRTLKKQLRVGTE